MSAAALEQAYREEWSTVVATLARRLGDLQRAGVLQSARVGGPALEHAVFLHGDGDRSFRCRLGQRAPRSIDE